MWKFWAIYAICLEQTRETLGIEWKYLITLHVVSLGRANHLHFHRKMWLENGHVIKSICIYSYPECMYVWWDLYHQFIWGTLTWTFYWPSILLIILHNFSCFSSWCKGRMEMRCIYMLLRGAPVASVSNYLLEEFFWVTLPKPKVEGTDFLFHEAQSMNDFTNPWNVFIFCGGDSV